MAMETRNGEDSLNQIKKKIEDLHKEYANLSEEQRKNSETNRLLLEQISELNNGYSQYLDILEKTQQAQQNSLGELGVTNETILSVYDNMTALAEVQETYNTLFGEESVFRKVYNAILGESATRGDEEIQTMMESLNARVDNIASITTSTTVTRESIVAEAESIATSRESASATMESANATRESVGVTRGGIGATRESASATRESATATRESSAATRSSSAITRESTTVTQTNTVAQRAQATATNSATVATSFASKAVGVFRAALASLGIPLIVMAIGTLVANFDSIRNSLYKAFPALEELEGVFDRITKVIGVVAGAVRDLVVNYFMTLAKVATSIFTLDFSGAIDAFADGFNKASDVIKGAVSDSIDAMNDFSYEHKKNLKKQQEKRLEDLEDVIETNKKKLGSDWQYSKEGQKAYKELYEAKKELYKDDAEKLKEVVEEEKGYLDKIVEYRRKVQSRAKAAQDKRLVAVDQAYKKEKLALKKSLAEGLISREQYAIAEEQLLIDSLEKQISLRQQFGHNTIEQEEQLLDLRIKIKEREDALLEKGKDIKEVEMEGLKVEAVAIKDVSDAEKALAEERKKQAEQRAKQAKEDEANLKKQQEGIKAMGKNLGELGKEVDTPWLSASLNGIGKLVEKFSDKFKKKNQENTESAEQAAEAQKSSFENVAGEIAQYSEILVGITGALFSKQNEMLAQEIEAAKEKYEALSAKYDEAVEKRKESDQELQNLEEQAKSARGGRLLHIQGQIDAEMAKNKQLSDQEKKLQTDKDKLQKDIEKKQKQQKKNEMKQQMISALANVATGATMALAQWGFPLGIINAAILGATGALQVAAIGKQMSKLEDGGLLFGRLHREGGMRIEGTNIEVEGGEYVVNRDSTRKNMGLIRYINSQRRELDGDDLHNFFNQPSRFPLFAMPTFSPLMEQGGQVPMMPTSSIDTDRLIETIQGINFQPRVSVTDIHTVQGQMAQVDEWVGM